MNVGKPSLEKLKLLPIKKDQNNTVRLLDIADIEFGPVTEKNLFKAQRKGALDLTTVGIGIYAKSGASTVELSNAIQRKISEVKKDKEVTDDDTDKNTMFLYVFLCFAMVFQRIFDGFLMDFRAV